VKAVVLVGGEGTRLRPLTLTTPKQMLPVAGRPMIERVVTHLARHGVDEVVLSLGYRPDAFLAAYPDGRCAGVRLVYAVEAEPLDTAGAVAFAARHAGIADRFVAVNGDVVTDMDLSALVAFHCERGAVATISLTPVLEPSRYGVVTTDDHGKVVAFVEKPPPGQAPTNLINAGTYVLEAEALDRIPAGRPVSIERETFPGLVADGSLYALASDASWVDAGTPATYLEVNLAVAAREEVEVDASARIDPATRVVRAVIGPGVVVEAGAVVEGSVLQAGARIGRGAVVRDSIVGRNVIVGAGATVEGLTMIGDGTVIDPGVRLCGARVPDSVELVGLVP
jgi:mannose-1-phosphate guanylyltransferase